MSDNTDQEGKTTFYHNSSTGNGDLSDNDNPNATNANNEDSSAREEQIGEASVTTAEFLTSTELTMIREFVTDEPSNVTAALQYCKRRILFPYVRLLGIMGLKPTLNPESAEHGRCVLIINKLYFILVVLLLLAGYTLQYLTCFRRDRGFVYDEKLMKQIHRSKSGEINGTGGETDNLWQSLCMDNVVLVHIFPSIFHLSSFFYMVYLYRCNEDEHLENLMSRVFIQAAHAHSTFFSQRKLLRTLQWLIMCSILWILSSTTCQLIQIFIREIFFNFSLSEDLKAVLLGTLALSTTWQDVIQVTVIVSYSIHCILLSTYLDLLYARVQQHTVTLQQCIKEIGEIANLISYLNNDLSIGLGPLLILDSATAVSSFGFLAINGGHIQTWDFVSLILVASLWLCLFIFPLIQAAKLSSAIKRLCGIGHLVRMRPFGYQDIPQDDLDSFLLYVSSLKLDVRIVKVPISTPVLAGSLSLVLFVTILWGLFLSTIVKHASVDNLKI